MAAEPYKLLLILLATSFVTSIFSLPENNILKKGEALSTSSSLVHDDNFFSLEFQSIGNRSYLGIWLRNDSRSPKPFWLGNRDQPIADNSGMLSIDGSGSLKLNYSGGDLVEFYSSSWSDRSSPGNNLAAVLEDTGDFVLRDGTSGEALWSSFDEPTDSLLPGMKLGTDHRTGKSRKLVSWLCDSVPSSGAFTLEWNSASQQLVVKRRGVTFWTAVPQASRNGELFGMETVLNYSYSIVSNADEDYFAYSVTQFPYPNSFPGLRNFTMWQLQYDGSIWDLSIEQFVLDASKCDGSYAESGCARWEGPECRRNGGDMFELRSGGFPEEYLPIYDTNSSLSISDCKDMCWKNCSCVGTTTTSNSDGTGCVFYYSKFFQDLSGKSSQFNVIIRPDPAANRDWIWILAAVAFALFVTLVAILFYLRWKRNKKRRLLKELLRMDTKEEGTGIDKNASDEGHNLTFYAVTTIMVATDNFSPQNKLGQGGFGPVYKVNNSIIYYHNDLGCVLEKL